MITIYCIVCDDKCRKLKKPKISYIFIKTLGLSIVYSKCGHGCKKIFKEEESTEILKILDLITNIEEYQKIYNHDWRKHKSRIWIEKYGWNKKLFYWRNKMNGWVKSIK